MPRLCLLLIAGLDHSLLSRAPNLPTLSSFKHRTAYHPAFPAVTCTTQASLTTGTTPDRHGIICNGLYTHNQPALHQHLDLASHADARSNVSFWEQSNSLLQAPRFWHTPTLAHKKTAMLFFQNSMPPQAQGLQSLGLRAADIVLTPKPQHTPEGKTIPFCWSNPATLYPTLVEKLGPFPLHNYWSPAASLPSSQWIARSAEHVWREHSPDLQLVYLPHLDFNLQRLGPSHPAPERQSPDWPSLHPAILKDLADLDALLAPLAARVRNDHAHLLIAGDYGMYDVHTPILPNLALRHAGLLKTRPDADGKLLIDYAASHAFVMADHQVAFAYIKPGHEDAAFRVLQSLPGLDQLIPAAQLASQHLATPRAGQALLLASPTAWFAHDYWNDDTEKPRWQFTVDIHNKPGFDPRELFFDPQKKCIAQDPLLVKGSHGRTDDPTKHPVLLSDTPLPPNPTATTLAPFLESLQFGVDNPVR